MKEIKKTSAEDLVKLLAEKREAVRAFRFDIAGSAKKNVKSALLARKQIARILTEENRRMRDELANSRLGRAQEKAAAKSVTV